MDNLVSFTGYLICICPFMWLGVCSEDITLVGRLIGEKVIMTEFIGYISLSDLKSAGTFTEEKSITMAIAVMWICNLRYWNSNWRDWIFGSV